MRFHNAVSSPPVLDTLGASVSHRVERKILSIVPEPRVNYFERGAGVQTLHRSEDL
jgi:hypothetical protein